MKPFPVGTVAATAGPQHRDPQPGKARVAGLFDTWNKALQNKAGAKNTMKARYTYE
ncbi:hypothetical protein [Streptomyces sp. NPDC056544]|uniref:hypothetical protein n=1 Tax=unclassified Streptomyces TaxID=2593676 RepID=UPI0036AD9417